MAAQKDPRPRVVLTGASNLTVGLGHVVGAAQAALGGPLEVLAALGHGRSYGGLSRFLGRHLPGVLECGLWDALAAADEQPTYALVTDVGNDLAFGVDPQVLLGWLARTLDALAERRARTVVTALPLERLRRLPAWEFELWRRFFFPFRGTRRDAVLDGAERVDSGLRALALERGQVLVEPSGAWYGRDPIHLRRARRAQAWATIVAAWWPRDTRVAACARAPLPAWWRLGAARRRILGLEAGREQPCARLPDGTTLALY